MVAYDCLPRLLRDWTTHSATGYLQLAFSQLADDHHAQKSMEAVDGDPVDILSDLLALFHALLVFPPLLLIPGTLF